MLAGALALVVAARSPVAHEDVVAPPVDPVLAAEAADNGPAHCSALIRGVSDDWCKKNCWGTPRFCPESNCNCSVAVDPAYHEKLPERARDSAKQAPSPEPSAKMQDEASEALKATEAKESDGTSQQDAHDVTTEVTESDHSAGPSHAKKLRHHKKRRSQPRDENAENTPRERRVMCEKSPCLPFCPLHPACSVIGQKEEVSRSSIQPTDGTEAEPTEAASDGRHADSSRKWTGKRRDHLKRMEDRANSRLCAKDPCQPGCRPTPACGLVASASIDGAASDAAVAASASAAARAARKALHRASGDLREAADDAPPDHSASGAHGLSGSAPRAAAEENVV
eukprot:Transcript_23695.p1 GENE.Transcript_23695~~Transcript_23695.p1  ORF type:complete len:339 (-),score=6.31 Transcript_23695:134-1150(-)